jgi:pantoate--beta-alanine ligase
VRKLVRAWRAQGDRIGFVPTMGALHGGHASLIARARRECDRVVASIFVNPIQFGPREDYARYPRPLARDRAILREGGTDLLYRPAASAMYPEGFQTRVHVARLSAPMEGAARPGHFDGVATVVLKLLAAVEPDRIYLGQKDAQQAAVLARMIQDLDLGVKVVVCPTVRERDGLALSSRNAYLNAEERAWAPALGSALERGAVLLRWGGAGAARKVETIVRRLLARGPGKLEYVRAVDSATLEAPLAGRPILLALAYRMPSARLIDNVVVRPVSRKRRR